MASSVDSNEFQRSELFTMNYLRLATFLGGALWVSTNTAYMRGMQEGEYSRTVFCILSILVSTIVFVTEKRIYRSKRAYLCAFIPLVIYGVCSWD